MLSILCSNNLNAFLFPSSLREQIVAKDQ